MNQKAAYLSYIRHIIDWYKSKSQVIDLLCYNISQVIALRNQIGNIPKNQLEAI